MPIKCFTGLGKYSHLSDKLDADKEAFKKKTGREMTEHEEKEAATKVALVFHADITKRLNGIIEEANKIKIKNGEKEITPIKGKQEKAAKDVSKIIKEYSKTIKPEQNAIPKPENETVLDKYNTINKIKDINDRSIEKEKLINDNFESLVSQLMLKNKLKRIC